MLKKVSTVMPGIVKSSSLSGSATVGLMWIAYESDVLVRVD